MDVSSAARTLPPAATASCTTPRAAMATTRAATEAAARDGVDDTDEWNVIELTDKHHRQVVESLFSLSHTQTALCTVGLV